MSNDEHPRGVRLLSVNVARPAPLGQHLGRPVESGFKKRPVAGELVHVDILNIEGDAQADLTAHGGPEKAVYAYSRDHDAAWRRELDHLDAIPPAYFGENLTVAGQTERAVRIGEIWVWGDARLQVCQPRWPCFKLALASGRHETGKIMLQHGWTGWYFRVLTPGMAPVGGPVEIVEPDGDAVTVFDAHSANLPGASRELVERVIAAPALASRWRATLQKSLARFEDDRHAKGRDDHDD